VLVGYNVRQMSRRNRYSLLKTEASEPKLIGAENSNTLQNENFEENSGGITGEHPNNGEQVHVHQAGGGETPAPQGELHQVQIHREDKDVGPVIGEDGAVNPFEAYVRYDRRHLTNKELKKAMTDAVDLQAIREYRVTE
jgi:hypothetical protein